MPPIRSLQSISQKWQNRAGQSRKEYSDGVNNPRRDWAQATADAQDAYNQGVQQAISAGRFATGVANAGTAKWKENTTKKGPDRWVQGISLSGDNYVRGFQPFANVIQNTTLPPRGPKNSPENYERSRLMGTALHEAKLNQ